MHLPLPQFSVLIAVYAKDNPFYFQAALKSIIEQTVKPSQILLVADGPLTIQLDDIIKTFEPQLDVLRLKSNIGLGAALALGLQNCKFTLVARMDSDDISLPNRFESQLRIFTQNPELSVVGGYIQEVDAQTTNPVAIRRVPLDNAQIMQYLKTRCPMNHVSVMFKRDDILKAGGYMPLHLMEDYYLWARVCVANLKMANIPQVLVDVRVDQTLYGRRGGLKYFKSNKALYAFLLQSGIINRLEYIKILAIRFTVQVLMPNTLRSLFYKVVLR